MNMTPQKKSATSECTLRRTRSVYHRKRIFVALSLLMALSSCRSPEIPARTQSSNIVFLSNRDRVNRQFDIFVTRLDGNEPLKLTSDLNSVTSFSNPQLSPDQRHILFFASEGFENKLQLMNADGGNLRTLTQVNIIKPEASFSPGGNAVVFVSTVDGKRQIHVIHLDGSNRINVSNNAHDEFEPSYSPDGSKILFTSSRAGARSVCIMNADGSGQSKLTDGAGTDSHPRFSPDGRRVVFASVRNRDSDIYLINLGGGSEENLTNSKTYESEPLFSPDGSTIIFISTARGMRFRDIVARDITGGKIHNLTQALNHVNQNAGFSTNGINLVFESWDNTNSDIYVMGIDGGNVRNLTQHPKWDCAPSF